MSESMPCRVADCAAPARGQHGLCNKHRLRLQRHGRLDKPTPNYALPCVVDGCTQLRMAGELCAKHRSRMRKYKSVEAVAFHVEKHGMYTHPLYRTWVNMRRRCEDPTNEYWERYGGRGIRVCDQWRTSFSTFVSDVGERPDGCTLDRIDGDGHYEPGNVRWASASMQQKNKGRRVDNTSGHPGVSWDRRRSRWWAYFGTGRGRMLGSFEELNDAIAARHRAVLHDPAVHCCQLLEAMRADFELNGRSSA